MMFGKMSKHQYVADYVLSNLAELFVSDRAWMFTASHMDGWLILLAYTQNLQSLKSGATYFSYTLRYADSFYILSATTSTPLDHRQSSRRGPALILIFEKCLQS
jgi:hypothetical protein